MRNYDILKICCKRIFLVGSGNFWYEENAVGDDKSLLYRAYSFILFTIYGFTTVLEIMAAVMGNFPEDEKRDSVTFAVSHTIVMIKIFSVISNRKLLKTLNRKMVTVCYAYEEKPLMAEKYRVMKMNVVGYGVVVYASVAFFVFEGLRKVHDGYHFVTVVTYYPNSNDKSLLAFTFRIFTTTVLCAMMMTMIVSVDTFTLSYMIMFKYKFITLRRYFENLRQQVDNLNSSGNEKLASEKLAQGLVDGIKMHFEVVNLLKDIDKAFGTVMALQLCQASGSAVSLLLQIALTDQLTVVARLKIISFIAGLFFLLGLFLCNAGEITYQASLLCDAIFYCGWHDCRPRVTPRRNIRRMVVLALVQAQRPLVMKAFKMLELSYATFLMIQGMSCLYMVMGCLGFYRRAFIRVDFNSSYSDPLPHSILVLLMILNERTGRLMGNDHRRPRTPLTLEELQVVRGTYSVFALFYAQNTK